ncbi:hypothetical protein [Gluconobacter sp. GP1]|uniref:hypothetical protein n=1 Tax=Gluconobacter sp. GP1 TaxID=3046423 RepID=UPI00293E5407|nr:hypothetical protein [Gluconobacter sp. GP1]
MNTGSRVPKNLKLGANVFNAHAQAAQYAYNYRLTLGSAAQSGATCHSLEPVSARFALTAGF